MKCFVILLAVITMIPLRNYAGKTDIKGMVHDKKTGAPLPFVSVSLPGSQAGCLTDEQGYFNLVTDETADSLYVFMVGYREARTVLPAGPGKMMDILLEEQTTILEEVSILGNNADKYRNRENPAVALIRKAIEAKDRNYDKGKTNVAYDSYEKLQVSLLRSSESVQQQAGNSVLSGLFKKADTTLLAGKAALPVFLHEKALQCYDGAGQGTTRQILLGEKRTSLDGLVDEEGLEGYFNKIYAAADVYDNNIMLGDQQLLSPLAGLAPQFYKYFITDTLRETVPVQVKLAFYPRNKADLLFKGELLIALDGSYAVTAAHLKVNDDINLNWVDDLDIQLQYHSGEKGTYYLQQYSLGMAMSAFGKKNGIYGEKTIAIKNYTHKQYEPAAPAKPLQESDWEYYRPQALSQATQQVYSNLDTLRKTPSFKRTANIVTLLLSGYEVLGPVEIGPVSSFYSFNPVEGSRLKLGGRTTEQFSHSWMLEGHAAYGLRDKQWKYHAGLTYSLNSHPVSRFPMRAVSAHYSYETQIPGQELTFMEEDNFLLSFKRGNNDKWLYNRKWNIDYVHETRNHISFRAGLLHSVLNPAGALSFATELTENDPGRTQITLSEITGEIRWAPHEQFYQGKKFRRPIFNSYPVFTLRGTLGLKGLMQSEYQYQSITLNIFKRFYLSQLGFSDVVLEGGRIFGKVPYPLLYVHKANQTYAYQIQAYNLMNFMEFVSDRYVSLHIDHSFNGFFLNKIPLVKKLQLREVASFKALYGDVGADNMPGKDNSTAFRFPADASGRSLTHSLSSGPYMEGSIGISNIFKILRVDVVKRFSYLDHPGTTSWGIRGRIVLTL